MLFIAAPWIFGFSDVSEAKTISIVLGVAILLTGMLTRWRMAIVKLIPLSVHRMMDLLLGWSLSRHRSCLASATSQVRRDF